MSAYSLSLPSQSDEAPDDACPACGGEGEVLCVVGIVEGTKERRAIPCPRCNGTGDRTQGPSARDIQGMRDDERRARNKERH